MSSPDDPTLPDHVDKPEQPVSLTVARPDAGNRRHEPHEPPRQTLPIKFFEARTKVHNKRIDGPFRRFKWLVMIVTLTIYYVTPWIRWDRGRYAPDQAVLVDVANRRFYMFDIEIWPQEFYFVAGLLIMAGIGLFLVTSAVGRAWCGYACPQTVWTDLFQHIDRFVDGDRNARQRLDAAPWTFGKFAQRAFKWSIYLAVAFATGGAWILYFADAPTLFREFFALEAAPIAYATAGILTLTTFTLGGFMREQVCIYMCPWPRIQAAMMDEKSLTVTYKDWRGEPRGSIKKAQKDPAHFGDCIDCLQCVAVCPTGIDIREGPQIGCITCALCIDACDRVMAEVGRPRGLIDYVTLEDAKREASGEPRQSPFRVLLRPRTLVYMGVWAAIGLAMLFALGNRARLDVSVAADRNPPFMLLSDGSVRNAYKLNLRNMQNRPRAMRITLDGLPAAAMWSDEMSQASASRTIELTVAPDATRALRLYVAAPPGTEAQEFEFDVVSLDEEGESATGTATFAAPGAEP